MSVIQCRVPSSDVTIQFEFGILLFLEVFNMPVSMIRFFSISHVVGLERGIMSLEFSKATKHWVYSAVHEVAWDCCCVFIHLLGYNFG